MARVRSFRRWLVPFAAVATALQCGGGDSLTLPSEGLPTAIALLAGDAQSGVVAQPLADSLVVRVTDQKARPVQNQRVLFQLIAGGAGGDLIPDTAVTDADGRARAVWLLGQLAGAQRVEARVLATGTAGTLKVTFNATGLAAAPDTVFVLAGDRQLGVVGTPLVDSLVVQVTDRFGNPAAGQGVAWAVPPGQGSISPVTTTSGADGRAAARRTLGPATGAQTASATAAGLRGSPVSFTATASASGPAALVKVSGDAQTAPAGFPLTDSVVVKLQDANGNGVPGRTVSWVAAPGSGSVTPLTGTTDAQGRAFAFWTLGPGAGGQVLTAASAGFQVSFGATATAAQPTRIASQSATTLNGTAGAAVTPAPSVKVTDANGNAVQGVTVTFQVTQGGGAVSDGSGSGAAVSLATNAQGVATLASWVLGAVAGTNIVTASATNAGGAPLTNSPITYTATGAAGAAAVLRVVTQPSAAAQSGVVLAQQPVLELRDGLGNPVSQSGVVITAAIVGPGATLGGTLTAATQANGRATFTGLTLNGQVGSYALGFASGSLGGDTSAAIVLSAGPAARLSVTTQPSGSAQSGVPFTVQPVVQLQDAAGNPVSQAGVAVTAALASGGGTLGGTAMVSTNAQGTAAFTDLAITGAAGPRTLGFSAPGLTGATSGTVTLGAGAATQLGLRTPPASAALSGSVLAQQPVVELRDASGNPVAQAGVTITASVSAGAVLGGTAQLLTDGQGRATYTDLSLSGPAASYTLSFAATGLTPVTSGAIALTAGAGTQLTLTTPPPATAQSGVALAPAPVLQLRDAAGNPVAQAGVSVTATIQAGAGGSLTGTATVTTDNAGQASFGSLAISGPPGSYTLAFGGTGLSGVTAPAITLGAGPAARLAIVTAPASTASNGAVLAPQPVLRLEDAAGNPVSQAGVSVLAAIASGGGSLGGTTTVATDAQGVASFTDLAITGSVGSRTLDFTATGLTTATSGAIQLTAGPATVLTRTASTDNQSATAGSPVPLDPQVRVTDQSGNPVAGASVSFTVTSGGGAAAAVVNTDAAGFAAVRWTLGPAAGTNTLDATAQLATGPATVTFTATGTAGSAGRLAMATQPAASAQSGVVLPQQPAVQLQDINGNNVTTSGVAVTASAPSSVALGGTAVAFTVNGVASFTNLSLTGPVGSYALTFTGTNLTGVTSAPVSLGAGAASKLVILTEPGSPTASGVLFQPQPVLQVQDASGNPVSAPGLTVTAAINSGPGGSLNPAGRTVTTDAAGVASYTALSLTGPTGGYTLLFSAPTLLPVQSAAFTITAGSATQMTAASSTSQVATVGTAVAAAPTVLVRDAQNNPVAGVSVSFQVTTGGGSLNGATAVSDAAGLAAVAGWTLGTTAGANTVTASAAGLPNVVFTATGTADAATDLVLNAGNNQTATVNAAVALAPSVRVTDQYGNPVAGVAVSFAVGSGGGSVTGAGVTSGSNGVAQVGSWVLGTTAGSNTLTATAGTLNGSPVSFTATGVAGAAATLALNAGNGQSATVGTAVPVAPSVLVTDAFGNPKSGQAVSFAVTGGGGSVTGGSATSTAAGIATVGSWTLGAIAGTNTLSATAAGLSGSPVSFTATGTTGVATRLAVLTAPPATAQSGIALTTQPVVQLQDANGNPVAQAGVSVNAALFSVARTLSNGTAVTDAQGQAAFSGLAINGLVGTDSLNFTSPPLTATARSAVVISAGTAVRLAVSRQASTTGQSGVAFAVQPQARLQDSVGNNVSLAGVVVTASIATGPAGATLVGTTTASTGATGVATFAGLGISGPVGTYTLQFDATGYTGVAGGNIAIAAGPASQLTITTQPPASVASGAAMVPAPVLQLRDGFGNPVPSAGIAITASVASGPGGTLTNALASTNAAGEATFTGLTLSGTAGSYTLSFAGTGLTPVASGSISLSAGGGSKLALTTQPSATATNGTAFPIQPVVQLQDASGNPVTQAGVQVAATVASGSALIGGTTTATTNASGVATFTNLRLTGAAGPHTLLFSATNFTAVASNTITLVASAPTAITLSAGNNQTATVGTAVAVLPAVLVTDQSGNPVSGVAVTFAVLGGGGSVTGGSATTNGSGIATPLGWTLGTTAGSNTLTATSGGLAGSPVTFTATGTAAAAAQLAMVTQPSASAQGGVVIPQQPAVRLLDQFGNAVAQSGVGITVSLGSGSGSLGGTTTVGTAGTGIATFSGLSISGPVGPYTLAFAGAGIPTGVSSSPITLTAAGSTTAISSVLPATTVVGEAYTVSVSVTGAGGTPTGTVVVSEGTASCNVTLSAGSGSCALASAVAGNRTISATYQGDANFLASPTATTPHVVSAAATTTTITADTPDPSGVGASYSVSVSVAALAPGAGTPTGTVSVSDGGLGSCQATLTAGAGSCSLASLALGPVTLTATYNGDGNFATSSDTEGHTVTLLGSTTTITNLTPTASVVGQSVSVSVSVTSILGTPSGSVSVTDSAGTSCLATLSGGAGSCNLAFPSPGTRSLVATYGGDATHSGSASPGSSFTVSQASTTTTITGHSPDPSTVGSPYTVGFSVVAAAPGAGTPTGTVTVSDGAGGSCAAAVSVGSCQITPATVGARTLTASYPGDANFGGSTSPGVGHTVGAIPTTTTVTLVSPGTIVLGQQVTVSFSVTAGATGNVSVSDGTAGCVAAVATGSCSFTPTSAGAKTITASYAGDATHGPSAGNGALQVDPFGAAAQLQFLVQPSTVLVNDKISPAVEVRILDAFGNHVTTATDDITMAIGTNPGSGTLGGTLTVTAVGGVATFGDLTIDSVASGYTLLATASGLAGATSAGFDVTP